MAGITQHIPNYILGVSEQPDELKTPGQVVDLKNGIPDITRGLIKRPGSDLISAITPVASGKWFTVYRDETETYIGQVASTGAIKIWRCSDGVEIPIDYASVAGSGVATYLEHSNANEIQPMAIGEQVLFCNRTKTVAMKTASTSKTPTAVYEAYIELRTIAYGKQYSLDIFDPTNHSTITYPRATSIEADEDVGTGGISGYSDDGKCEGMGRHIVGPSNTNSGTAYSAGGTGKTNLRYEMDVRCAPVPQAGGGSNDYDDSYQTFATLQFGGEGWSSDSGGDTHTYVSEKGLSTTVRVKSHVNIKSRANVALVRPEPTSSNSEENVSAESILNGIKTALDAISGTGITATICGNGIHLHRATPFLVTTPETQLMNVITGEANDASDLPKACRHNYVVKVVNSGEDQDDYYVQFKVNNIDKDNEVTADYGRSGTTITITSASHGLLAGDTLIADFTLPATGAATDGWYPVASVTDANIFTVTDSASGLIGSQTDGVTYIPNRFGTGVWEECAAPNLEIEFDDDTMPLKITRVVPSTQYTIATSDVNTSNEQITITGHGRSTGDRLLYDNGGGTALAGLVDDTVYYVIKVDANTIKLATNSANATAGTAINLTGTGNNDQTLTYGYFAINGGANGHYPNGAYKFDYPDWGKRDVGDDVTNPKPSFVGYTINKVFFYRNRIGLLSEENVILSRTNDFYNFWAKTAFTISNADPIDLQASSTFPTQLYDALEVNTGLLIFSSSQQFLLSTDEAILTPETAKIAFLSSYAFNEKTRPFSMGITSGFINSTAKNTRFYEMVNVQRNQEPDVIEQSKIISKLFPDDITLPAESTENDMVLFGSEGKNEIWGYRFFNQGDKRVQSAWFRWLLPGNLVYHTTLDDTYYTVIKNGSTYTLESTNIKKDDDTPLVGTSPTEYKIHLDTKKEFLSSTLTYNGSTNQTTLTLGAGFYSSNQLQAYCHKAGNQLGRAADVVSVTGTAPNETVTLDGNWKYANIEFAHTLVDTSAETITLTSHGRATGDALIYKQGTTAISGLSDGTTYYIIKVDNNTIKLATSSSNATAGTAINLASQGSGTHAVQIFNDLYLGYSYEFEIELPTIYVQKQEGEKVRSEIRGSLILHRLNFNFGSVGLVSTTLKRKGREDYSKNYESIDWDNYKSSSLNIAEGYIHTIPVYDRNINTTVQLKSTHPSPATLFSMSWEGDYTNKYYRRV